MGLERLLGETDGERGSLARLALDFDAAAVELDEVLGDRKAEAGASYEDPFLIVSKQLSVLANAGIVEGEKRGLQVFYSLRCPCVLHFFSCVENVIQTKVETTAQPTG